MSYSYTSTESSTFTKTHAIYIEMKMATDLKRMQRLYGTPDDALIDKYSIEIFMLLLAGYLKCVTYGFQKNGKWIEPMLKYTAYDLNNSCGNDDDPGRIKPGCNILGANFSSFLEYNDSWYYLSLEGRNRFEQILPFKRGVGIEPGINGYLSRDLTYSAGGRAVYRESLRSF